jgi:hypothetical protein
MMLEKRLPHLVEISVSRTLNAHELSNEKVGDSNNTDRCSSCNGTGRCAACGGTGDSGGPYTPNGRRCPLCHGSGACPYCGGKGYK